MKKWLSLILVVMVGLSFSQFALAEGEAAKAPAQEQKVVAQPAAAAESAEKVEAVKLDDSMADTEEPEEESEDVKILREAAAKLKASDPGLSAKLEQLAEDFSW